MPSSPEAGCWLNWALILKRPKPARLPRKTNQKARLPRKTNQKARLPRKTGLTARLNVFAGTSAKHILNSMFAPTIIANVIKAFWKSILHR
jgi:hypothetical protein